MGQNSKRHQILTKLRIYSKNFQFYPICIRKPIQGEFWVRGWHGWMYIRIIPFWHPEYYNGFLLIVALSVLLFLQSSLNGAARLILVKCNSDHNICSKSPNASYPRKIEVPGLAVTYDILCDLAPVSSYLFYYCSPFLSSPLHSNHRKTLCTGLPCTYSFLLITPVPQKLGLIST